MIRMGRNGFGVSGMSGMRVLRAETEQSEDSSREDSKSQLSRKAGPITCYNASYRWPLSHRGHTGTAEEDIRLY